MNVKKGDIVVRTEEKFQDRINELVPEGKSHIGVIFKTVDVSNISPDRAKYSEDCSVREGKFRRATKEECDFYNRGGRHIDDMIKYEVGTWYKCKMSEWSIYYKKFLELLDNKFWSDQTIDLSLKNFSKSGGFLYYNEIKDIPIANMNEVSEYLPDGHPDKMPQNPTSNVKIGNWYIARNKNNSCTYYMKCSHKDYNNIFFKLLLWKR